MNFEPQKALEIPRKSGLVPHKPKELAAFWEELDELNGYDVSGGIGCYIFAIRAGKGVMPWYVGLAEKQSFKKECFAPHKINHYNSILAEHRGTPMLTVVAKHTPGGKLVFPNGNGHRDIQQLETMLIGNCLSRNTELLNIRDTKLLREMRVSGLLNTATGRPPTAVSDFKRLIGA